MTEKYETVDGVYCPIADDGRVTGVHRELVSVLKEIFYNSVLEVGDLDGGELYFGINSSALNGLRRFVERITAFMRKHNPEWDGEIFLANTIKEYENPLGVKAWTSYHFTITSAPYLPRD